jgi:hypothetical protein
LLTRAPLMLVATSEPFEYQHPDSKGIAVPCNVNMQKFVPHSTVLRNHPGRYEGDPTQIEIESAAGNVDDRGCAASRRRIQATGGVARGADVMERRLLGLSV